MAAATDEAKNATQNGQENEQEGPERKITRSYWRRYFRPRDLILNNWTAETSRNVCGKYNVSSSWGRRLQTLKILSVSFLAMIGLLAFVIIDVMEAQSHIAKEQIIKQGIDASITMANLIHKLQIERGTTVLCISSRGDGDIGKDLTAARLGTDNTISAINTWPEGGKGNLHSHEIFVKALGNQRNNGDVTNCLLNATIQDTLDFYTGLIDTMLDWLFHSIFVTNKHAVLFELLGYRMFLIAKEKSGLERAMGGSFFSRGFFNDTDDLVYYAQLNIIGEIFLNHSMDYMSSLEKHFLDVTTDKGDMNFTIRHEINAKRQIILKNEPKQGDAAAGRNWFKLMTEYIDILLDVQGRAGDSLRALLTENINSSENQLIIRFVILGLVILSTPLLFIAVTTMTNTIQQFALKLAKTTESLSDEQQRTDELLSAMFPRPVAETLKKGERVNSEHYDCVTVFFSDIVNFTNICAMITPMMVTRMLNSVYSVFDDHIDKYDVYKVETIGDAYMVVSGLPIRNGTQHADEIARMALGLVQITEDLKLEEIPLQEKLLVRVGVHTGSCVTGVVGNKMPRYCLFGDTVNTASRMQSAGIPQKIHISETTRDLLEKFNTYDMEYRGNIKVKGKGTMDTYWLLGRKDRTKTDTQLPGIVNQGFSLNEIE